MSHLLHIGLVAQVRGQAAGGFNPSANGPVHAMALQTNGNIVVGGEFTTVSGQERAGLARVDTSGILDTNFAPAVGGEFAYVAAIAVDQSGKILVGGYFTTLAGHFHSCLGRLNEDGSFDSSFAASADSDVYGVLVQPDGKSLVWGNFLSLGSLPQAYAGRLNADGSPDTNFAPALNDQVFTAAVQSDGKILLGGAFSLVHGTVRNGLARLNTDGTVDAAFNPDPGNFATVSCLAVQPDGKILVAGRFSQLAGKPRTNIGRVNADGSLDSGFDTGVLGGTPVFSMALQADGKSLLGGQLTSLAGQKKDYLGRLLADGKLDTTFEASADAAISALVLQPDGNLLAGGAFSSLGGEPRAYIGRLATAETSTDRLSSDGTSVTWVRSGPLPELWAATFEASINGTDWTALGAGMPGTGGWQVTNVTVQPDSFVRARGYVAASRRNGSSYVIEKTQKISADTPPVILVNDGSFGWSQGRFGFNVRGLPGQTAVVEGSMNLAGWVPLSTNRFTAISFYFSDPAAPLANRYYRVRLQ